jgi:nucleotide-binding universal stress UspA family protein
MKKVLVGLDGSINSYKALEEAISLSKLSGAELHTITVVNWLYLSGTMDEIEEGRDLETSKYNEYVRKAKAIASSWDCTIKTHLLEGHEVKTICEFIRRHRIDLLVIGFVGRSAIYKRIIGRTSLGLARVAPCSVLIVK